MRFNAVKMREKETIKTSDNDIAILIKTTLIAFNSELPRRLIENL